MKISLLHTLYSIIYALVATGMLMGGAYAVIMGLPYIPYAVAMVVLIAIPQVIKKKAE